MSIHKSIGFLFEQLNEALEELTDQQYQYPSSVLSNATVGQHLRHIIEFYMELNKGYETGTVNYDLRQRDHRIETERSFAIEKINELRMRLNKPDRALRLSATLSADKKLLAAFSTNYYRELLYNLEHTVHHMALIRIGIQEVTSIKLSPQFGVAESTLAARKLCAQ